MTPAEADPESGEFQLSHRQIVIVLGGLMLGMLLAALDQTIVATALPTIVQDLGGLEHLSWVVTAYLLTSTASTLLYGKVSDLYGRKVVFQFAIVVFLVGSVLSGLAQNMEMLIASRAVQGLGAGGLMVLALTIIGDIIPPRERGRYQGYFAGTFAIASIVGPLAGGFFVDNLTWRWVFYINLPLGLVALFVTSAVLNLPFRRRQHDIDYLGAALMVAGVSALLLVTVWGGSQYSWGSWQVVALLVTGIGCIALFVWWETRRAIEPILPMRLFRNDIFSVSAGMMFILGAAMFGATVYLPVYLQLARGVSPTASGLLLLPMVAGMMISSISSGRAVSRLGTYRPFPIAGTALMTVGMWLFAHLQSHTPFWQTSLFMLTVGLGMGMIMPIVTLAVQNGVERADMGVATSSVTFFRAMGASFGTAMFGAILTARLTHWLHVLLPPDQAERLGGSNIVAGPAAVHALPPPIRTGVIEAFVHSLHTVFLVGVPVASVAFLFALFLRQVDLARAPVVRTAEAAVDGVPAGGLEVAAAAVADEATG